MICRPRSAAVLPLLMFTLATAAAADCIDCRFSGAKLAFLQSPQPPLGEGVMQVHPQSAPEPVPQNTLQAPGKPSVETPAAADAGSRSDRCLSIAEMADRDRDFERNRAQLESPDICMTKKTFREGSLPWTLQIIQNKAKPGDYFWFVPHDNENAAFDTAAYGVRKFGGTVVAVETGGNRNNHAQDPNRNFDAGGTSPQKCREQVARSPLFTANVLEFLHDDMTVIALHSNTPGGGISMRSPLGGNRHFPARVPFPSRSPDDTMIFVASTAPPEHDPNLRSFVSKLNDLGINVIYETVSPTKNDCSFSNYAALKGIRDYVNLEVVTDDGPGQIRMLELVMPLLERGIDPEPAHSGGQAAVRPPAARNGDKTKQVIDARPREAERQVPAPLNAPAANPPAAQEATASPISRTRPDRPAAAAPEQPPAGATAAGANPAPAAPARSQTQGGVIVKVDFAHTEQEALKAKRDLEAKGLKEDEVFIRPGMRSGKPEFGIFIGPFAGTTEALRRCDELKLPNKKCYVLNNR